MTTIEKATQFMEGLAADNSHGYDQANRWGPDFDCSSAVISAWQNAGVPVKSYGASYTGNMYPVFKQCGFTDVTSTVNLATGAGLQRGDVLLNHTSHTAMFVGNGTIAHASINEHGGTTGGQSGDQTGREICLRSYYNYPWNVVLRYTKGGSVEPTPTPEPEPEPVEKNCTVTLTMPVIEYGDRSLHVKIMQTALIGRGFSCGWCGADGDYGNGTKNALLAFQKENQIEQDTVCGRNTWRILLQK